MRKNFWLFRHGETPRNKLKLIPGGELGDPKMDLLSDVGMAQAQELSLGLSGTPIEIIVSSDKPRAQQTGGVVATAQRIPMIVNAGLTEANHGSMAGRPRAELSKEQLAKYNSNSEPDFHFDGGETQMQIATRAMNVLKEMAESKYNSIGICSHGGVLRYLMGHYFGLVHEGALPNAVPYHVVYDNGVWSLEK